MIDRYEWDTVNGLVPELIHVSGDVFAVAYTGASYDGFIRTLTIAADGQISGSIIDSLEFDTTAGIRPSIVKVSADIFAVAYRGAGDDGTLKTVQIDASGQITNAVIDTLIFDTSASYTPDILFLGGDIYGIAYRTNRGNLITVEISPDGEITDAVIDSVVYNNANGADPDLVMVNSSIIGVAYTGAGTDGFITTVELE